MKKLLVAVGAMPFMAGVALAGPPSNTQFAPNATVVPLNDQQMDHVNAGSVPAPSIAEAAALVKAIVLTTPTSQPVRLPYWCPISPPVSWRRSGIYSTKGALLFPTSASWVY